MKKRPITAAVLGSVIAAAALTGCGGAAPGLSAAPLPTASGPVRPPTVARGLPAERDLTAMVLPATGRDSRLTQGLDGFAQLVGHARLQECAEQAGVRLPEVPPPAYIGWSDLPDLGFIGRHGLTMSVPALPSASPSGRAAGRTDRTDRAAQQRCETEGRTAAKEFKDLYSPLQSLWWPEVSAVRDDPRAREALRKLPGCLARYGVEVEDEDAFFALVDRTVQGIEDGAEATRADRGLGAAYAACMASVEAVREPLRTARRTAFEAAHRDELRALERGLLPRIRELEHRHGLTFGHPVP
ncbi:hypothetical protein NC315_04775 [Streptomyces sp. G2]|uniref:hypothetical protein n=1 Tax=Streptomyces sp. G2 TaxID=1684471 RepID=UPI00202E11F5|nr:hypothetical protein [Streptomyces sp. G2]MCM1944687.1 hypothetical protein [Streptomyces sp. G2]